MPYAPIVVGPAVPSSPLNAALAGAAAAIHASTNTTARARAAELYRDAQGRALAGDVAGSLATARLAQTAAWAPASRVAVPLDLRIAAPDTSAQRAATSAALLAPAGRQGAGLSPRQRARAAQAAVDAADATARAAGAATGEK